MWFDLVVEWQGHSQAQLFTHFRTIPTAAVHLLAMLHCMLLLELLRLLLTTAGWELNAASP